MEESEILRRTGQCANGRQADHLTEDLIVCRHSGDVMMVPRERVDFMDVSPKQLVSVAAASDPVPRERRRQPRAHGLEHAAPGGAVGEAPTHRWSAPAWKAIVARDSGAAIAARRTGYVDQIDATRIVVRATEDTSAGRPGVDIYRLMKFQRSNQSTCVNQKPLVRVGDFVRKGEILADGPVDRARRSRARPQRARRIHAVERLQLRGLDPAQRADRQGRRLHLDPHRRVRGDGPRHQARA